MRICGKEPMATMLSSKGPFMAATLNLISRGTAGLGGPSCSACMEVVNATEIPGPGNSHKYISSILVRVLARLLSGNPRCQRGTPSMHNAISRLDTSALKMRAVFIAVFLHALLQGKIILSYSYTY